MITRPGMRLLAAKALIVVTATCVHAEDERPAIFDLPVVPTHVVSGNGKVTEVEVKKPLAQTLRTELKEKLVKKPSQPNRTITTAEPMRSEKVADAPMKSLPKKSHKRTIHEQGVVVASPVDRVVTEQRSSVFPKPKNHIEVRPGENQILKVAIGHLNRIVTPYANPIIQHIDDPRWHVEKKGNAIFVSRKRTNKQKSTLGIFITDGQNQDTALVVTLWAQNVPPQDYILKTEANQYSSAAAFQIDKNSRHKKSSSVSNSFEKAQPFASSVLDVLSAIAVGEIPTNYDMRSASYSDVRPFCATPRGVKTNFRQAQIMEGKDLQVVIGVIENSTVAPVTLQEGWCGTKDVRAVAYWPGPILPAGGKAEVFVMRTTADAIEAENVDRRPSLIE